MISRLSAVVLICAAAHASPALLDQGYRQMYDLRFPEAHQTFAEYQRQHPEDPLGPVSDAAAYLFSEFDRLHILQSEFFTQDRHFITDRKLAPDPELKRKFEAALEAGRRLSARTPGDANAMFAVVLAGGLHGDYLALIDKRYAAAFQEMKAGRQQAERLLAADPQCYDAWIAVGVENYMLSVKAAPVRWLLRLAGGETDRAVGLRKLRLTAEKGRYLAPFAKLLLAVAALRDNDAAQARQILDGLSREYPHNPLYALELAKLPPVTGVVVR
jgi:hypothetical protein